MFVQRNNVRSIKKYFQERLKEYLSPSEIKLIVRECVCRRLGLSFSNYLLSDDQLLSESDLLYFRSVVKRLLDGEPFQYISENVLFYGLELYITSGALIPRPETEELVDWIVHVNSGHQSLNILDVCSGSGCIAFGLERGLEKASVTAIELSNDACVVWNINREKIQSNAILLKGNVLDPIEWNLIREESLDIIVSNPPYITKAESKAIATNVIDHEPHIALFVSSDDPLQFYKAILLNGLPKLKQGGEFYFELNPLYAEDIVHLMEELNLVNITLRKDLQWRDRMLMGQKP
jgi:release factor glutamine methyltransferase